jgi:hypothetical protein
LNALTAREKEEMGLYYNTVMEKRNSKDTDNMSQPKHYTDAEQISMQEKKNLELRLQIEADKNSAKLKKEAKQWNGVFIYQTFKSCMTSARHHYYVIVIIVSTT